MGGMDQYTSQFIMRERIGPSQADGNPAVPRVVSLHCLSAGYQFLVLLCTKAPQLGNDCYHTGSVVVKYLLHFLRS